MKQRSGKIIVSQILMASLVVLSVYFLDKFLILDDEPKRRLNNEFSRIQLNLSIRISHLSIMIHVPSCWLYGRTKNRSQKSRNQYVYQLCSRYHIDYSIFIQCFSLFSVWYFFFRAAIEFFFFGIECKSRCL